jgi:hypothetical protein
MPPRARGHELAGTRGQGPLASGPCHKFSFFQNFKIITNFVIEIGDLPNVQNSPNFARQ